MKNDNVKLFGGCLGWLTVAILLIILGPAMNYFFGWITGHLLNWVCGDTIVNGLNYLFNTTRFTADNLPMICGTLGTIGSFFKNSSVSSSDKK